MNGVIGVAWENVLVGLLGGLVVTLVTVATRRARDLLLQRKYPVAGDYITKFEDQVDGQSVTVTAPATLRQRGNRVDGLTTLEGREWSLSGSLSRDGYVHGVYSAVDPLDKGMGNFFLRVRSNRHLDGLWSGYDSANDTISSGRYSFRPVTRGVRIRDFREDDKLSMLRIADTVLGEGYLDDSVVAACGAAETAFAKVAESQGRIVGFALCLLISSDQAVELCRVSVPRHVRLADRVGVVKTVGLDPDAQGYGVGTRLCRAALDEFGARGVAAVCSVAWKKSSGGINIDGVLSHLGFTVFGEVPDYWRADSEATGFPCPACGEPPCRCSAVMYSLVLPNQPPTRPTQKPRPTPR